VGDMAFQMKCFKKFEDLQNQNKTILFVTHALDTVIRYCNRSIVIENGEKIADTGPKDGVDIFKKVLTGNIAKRENTTVVEKYRDHKILKNEIDINNDALEYGNNKVKIVDFCILDSKNKPNTVLDFNTEFSVYMKIHFLVDIENPIFAFTIKDVKGLELTGTNTMVQHILTGTYKKNEIVTVTFSQKANIQSGTYALSLGCVDVGSEGIEVYARLYDAVFFDIVSSEQMVGFYDLFSDIEIKRVDR